MSVSNWARMDRNKKQPSCLQWLPQEHRLEYVKMKVLVGWGSDKSSQVQMEGFLGERK